MIHSAATPRGSAQHPVLGRALSVGMVGLGWAVVAGSVALAACQGDASRAGLERGHGSGPGRHRDSLVLGTDRSGPSIADPNADRRLLERLIDQHVDLEFVARTIGDLRMTGGLPDWVGPWWQQAIGIERRCCITHALCRPVGHT